MTEIFMGLGNRKIKFSLLHKVFFDRIYNNNTNPCIGSQIVTRDCHYKMDMKDHYAIHIHIIFQLVHVAYSNFRLLYIVICWVQIIISSNFEISSFIENEQLKKMFPSCMNFSYFWCLFSQKTGLSVETYVYFMR